MFFFQCFLLTFLYIVLNLLKNCKHHKVFLFFCYICSYNNDDNLLLLRKCNLFFHNKADNLKLFDVFHNCDIQSKFFKTNFF